MIEQLIHTITQQLAQRNIAYMIIGGQAVLIYGRPRLTRDIDITLGIDTNDFNQIDNLCRDLNLNPLPDHPKDFASQTRVLPVEDVHSKIRIDFIFSFMPYERQAIEHAKTVHIGNYSAKFASCEDVIIHKMIAGRAIDEEDVKSILAKNRATLDRAYIEKWLKEFSLIPEYERVFLQWSHLLEEVQ